MRFKLFVSYTLPVLLLFGLFMALTLRDSMQQSRDSITAFRSALNQQSLQAINSNMSLLDKQSTILYADQASLSNLFSGPDNRQYYYARNNITSLLTTQLQLNDNLEGVALLTLDGVPYLGWNHSGNSLNLYNSAEDEWFRQTLQNEGKPLVRAGHRNQFYFGPSHDVVSVSRTLYSTIRQPLGVVVAYQSLDYVVGLLNQTSMLEGEQLLLCDQNGGVIWSSQPIEQDAGYAGAVTGVTEVRIDGIPMLCTVSPPTNLGWRIVSYLPLDEMSFLTESLRRTNVIMLLALVLLSFVLSAAMAYIVTKPLTQLTQSFEQVSAGNFDVPVSISGKDELAVIGQAYNEMLQNTKQMIRERYEMRMLITRAELEALQSQINPHFMFNTLNSIKIVADGEEPAKAALMVQMLADLLRYNLSEGRYSVTFAEDLAITRKYIYLQQCRFGERYQVDYEIDEAVMPLSILKLTLQPLVENAIRHGLEPSASQGRLHIVAKRLGEKYVVYIANTGKIIDEDTLKLINDQLAAPLADNTLSPEKLGVFNVNRRLRLHYGETYGLRFSRGEEYTTVRLMLPAIVEDAPHTDRKRGEDNAHSDG